MRIQLKISEDGQDVLSGLSVPHTFNLPDSIWPNLVA